MSSAPPQFRVKLAETEAELRAAQALRYRVFVQELGADGEMVDHEAGLEVDRFDADFDHLLLIDDSKNSAVVGVYRLLLEHDMPKIGQFYSEGEYDISVLKSSGRKLLELGRSCLDTEYRGGAAMYYLWNGLAEYVTANGVEILFGTASFHGTDVEALAAPLTLLHDRHLAPEDLRVRTLPQVYQRMDLCDPATLDRRKAMLQVPALIKGYLRLGGFVGDGAFVDHDFNTVDVCLVMDTKRLSETQKSIYAKGVEA